MESPWLGGHRTPGRFVWVFLHPFVRRHCNVSEQFRFFIDDIILVLVWIAIIQIYFDILFDIDIFGVFDFHFYVAGWLVPICFSITFVSGVINQRSVLEGVDHFKIWGDQWKKLTLFRFCTIIIDIHNNNLVSNSSAVVIWIPSRRQFFCGVPTFA